MFQNVLLIAIVLSALSMGVEVNYDASGRTMNETYAEYIALIELTVTVLFVIELLLYSIGLGLKGDLPYGSLYYKGEVTYTDFETYEADGAGNKVSADLDATTARLSIGYKF